MMSFFIGLLTVTLVLDCLLLILLVLIQLPKKEAGAGIAFGGGATDALFGAGSGTALTKITKYAAGGFLALSLVLFHFAVPFALLLSQRLKKQTTTLVWIASWLLFMRLMPLFPYFLVNLAPALTDIRVRTYVAATVVGILPSTLIVTNLGQTLGSIESTRGLLTPDALLALSLLGVLALLPVLLHYVRSKRV